jgi:hypothetical protein
LPHKGNLNSIYSFLKLKKIESKKNDIKKPSHFLF